MTGTGDRRPHTSAVTGREAGRFAVDLAHLAAVRHAVAEFAAWHGLADRAHADFVLAVNELVSNAVQHGGGGGDVRLWHTRDAVWCEVADRGPGLPPGRPDRYRRPPATASGGRGLWLVHQMCDQVTIASGPGGTTVRVAKRRDRAGADQSPGAGAAAGPVSGRAT